MEVAQYANHLTGIEDMELFERHGEPVDERTFSSTEEALETVLEKWLNRREEFETEALIFLTEREAEHAFLYIEKRLKGLTVTTFYLAKGLEFDQVFGIFEEDRESGLQCQAKYITATRALHELHMYMMENSK